MDGLTPSKYLYETARRNIDGEITIEEAKQLIDSYYETRQGRTEDEDDTEEADMVSVSIREILAIKEKKFGDNQKASVQNVEIFGVNKKTSVQIIEK
ncbi:antitoxin VbhA family protein [Treponema sp. UBA3813]|uniref:antitoxin VbhA family protein n=1 Tax=Treponema sp. UBA3813 TaxID=1947715 RepID=UPI0025D7C2AA|nr:antitoxin VbhA family protein [Treponema sp. UBA3813]